VRGPIVDGGPDHCARLEAAKLFIRLISSRGVTQAPDPDRELAARCSRGQRGRRRGAGAVKRVALVGEQRSEWCPHSRSHSACALWLCWS